MSDILCRKCREPWEVYYLRNEAGYDWPGPGAPDSVTLAFEAWEDAQYSDGPDEPHDLARNAHDAVYRAVASGLGCPSCWADPSRILSGEEAEEAALAGLYSLFDGTDDDPAEFL